MTFIKGQCPQMLIGHVNVCYRKLLFRDSKFFLKLLSVCYWILLTVYFSTRADIRALTNSQAKKALMPARTP